MAKKYELHITPRDKKQNHGVIITLEPADNQKKSQELVEKIFGNIDFWKSLKLTTGQPQPYEARILEKEE